PPPPPAAGTTATSTAFDTPVTASILLGGALKVTSPVLPPSTKEVDIDEEFSDADVTRMAAALKLALAAYNAHNTRLQADAVTTMCLFYNQYPEDYGDEKEEPTCSALLYRIFYAKKTSALRVPSAAGSCPIAFVPLLKKGTTSPGKQIGLAVA